MIDLNIPFIPKPEKRTYKADQRIWDTFDKYVQAAKETNEGISADIVLEHILQHHLGRDKKFKKWLDSDRANDSKRKDTSIDKPKVEPSTEDAVVI